MLRVQHPSPRRGGAGGGVPLTRHALRPRARGGGVGCAIRPPLRSPAAAVPNAPGNLPPRPPAGERGTGAIATRRGRGRPGGPAPAGLLAHAARPPAELPDGRPVYRAGERRAGVSAFVSL